MTTLHFTGFNRAAAEHLLASDFGTRLHQVARRIVADDHALTVAYIDADMATLSSGEIVLLGVLESLGNYSPRDMPFTLADLSRLDDPSWDLVVAALFKARGREPSEITYRAAFVTDEVPC